MHHQNVMVLRRKINHTKKRVQGYDIQVLVYLDRLARGGLSQGLGLGLGLTILSIMGIHWMVESIESYDHIYILMGLL